MPPPFADRMPAMAQLQLESLHPDVDSDQVENFPIQHVKADSAGGVHTWGISSTSLTIYYNIHMVRKEV